NAAPVVESAAAHHDRIALCGIAVRRGEGHDMPGVAQHAPADCHFARIEVPARQRNQHVHGGVCAAAGTALRFIQAYTGSPASSSPAPHASTTAPVPINAQML